MSVNANIRSDNPVSRRHTRESGIVVYASRRTISLFVQSHLSRISLRHSTPGHPCHLSLCSLSAQTRLYSIAHACASAQLPISACMSFIRSWLRHNDMAERDWHMRHYTRVSVLTHTASSLRIPLSVSRGGLLIVTPNLASVSVYL